MIIYVYVYIYISNWGCSFEGSAEFGNKNQADSRTSKWTRRKHGPIIWPWLWLSILLTSNLNHPLLSGKTS